MGQSFPRVSCTLALATAVALLPSIARGEDGLVFVPAAPCTLVRTAGTTDGKLEAGETRTFLARGVVNLSPRRGCRTRRRAPPAATG